MEVFDWATGLEDADDSDIYFSPDVGNVLFASAYDGWAFDLGSFAKIYSEKLGFSQRVLTRNEILCRVHARDSPKQELLFRSSIGTQSKFR